MVHVNRVVITMLGDASNFNRMADRVISKTMQMSSSFSSMGANLAKIAGAGTMGMITGGALGFIVGLATGGTLAMVSAGFDIVTGSITRMANVLQQGAEHILSFGTHIIETGMKFELFRADFETMTGSIQKGALLFQQVKDLTIRTPYTFEQLARANQLLLGMGVAPEHSIQVMSRLGDIAGGNVLRLQRLALAYGQVVSAGRFMGTELRQFAEAGMGAADFGRANNMTGAEFRELMSQGRVSVSMMIRGINAVTSDTGRFAHRNERMLQTVSGQWVSMKERVEIAISELAEEIFKKFDIVGKMNIAAKLFGPLQKEAGPILEKLFGWFERAQPSMLRVVDMAGSIAMMFVKGAEAVYDMAPAWTEVEKVLKRIAEDTLPMIASMIQGILVGILNVTENLLNTYNSPIIGHTKDFLNFATPLSLVSDTAENLMNSVTGDVTTRQTFKRLEQNVGKLARDIDKADWFDSMQQSSREWQRLSRSLSKMSVGLDATAALIGPAAMFGPNGGVGLIPEEPIFWKISDAAKKVADKLLNEGMAAVDPMLKMQEGMQAMNEAFWGPKGIGRYGLNGPIPEGPLADRPDLFRLGKVEAFEAARRMLGPEPESILAKMEKNLPKAITRGSKEAVDTMQRSIAAAKQDVPLDERQKAIRDLKRIAEAGEKAKERLGIIADVLERIEKAGGLEAAGF